MNQIPSVHGNEYLEDLRLFRDRALAESHISGTRRRLGGFVFGAAEAAWETAEDGLAHLLEGGLRYKDMPLTKFKPTTLRLFHFPEGMSFEVVTYNMDIDDIGCIEIYRNLFTSASLREVAAANLRRRADRKHGLSEPTDEQRRLLYTEMKRGASGRYAVTNFKNSEN